LLLLICALNTTHNAVYNQCVLYINQDLLGSQYQLKLTLSVYFCAIFFIRCVVGTIADNCSGKKCMLVALLVALLGHTLAGYANSIETFIVARFIQGLGLGGGQVLGLVLLMQVFTQKSRASIIAAEQVLFSLASVCLPLMGNLFSSCLSWRLTYIAYFSITAFAIFYFITYQKESVPVESPIENFAGPTPENRKHILLNRAFLTPTFMACFSISGYILWGSYFSLLVHHYDIELKYLLMYQLLPIVPYFTCSLLFKRLTGHLSRPEVYRRILFFQASAWGIICALFLWNKGSNSFKFMLLLPIILHNIAGSFFRPLMQEKALNSVPNNKIGAASSFISICQVGVNAVFAIVINCMKDFLPTFVGIQLFIGSTILIYILGTRSCCADKV
ncbi:MAG: MFS transporter, partial [bacterium]